MCGIFKRLQSPRKLQTNALFVHSENLCNAAVSSLLRAKPNSFQLLRKGTCGVSDRQNMYTPEEGYFMIDAHALKRHDVAVVRCMEKEQQFSFLSQGVKISVVWPIFGDF